MLLKRLELLGFKSFAERTVVDLAPGVTAVVGPNGSGKSNLSDAVRWVLGEGSARALRGGRMEDVIFGGSGSRRPLPLAEVTLVVDNDDGLLPVPFSEVAVTRRVDRAGDGEYLIGRAACRLRDIQDMFYGTGLGKSAYAIVSQGEIEALLTARPEERRAAVEEAAGVTRYRARRTEADRRLAAAGASCTRLADILEERRRALGPLERQAERARRHAALSAQLREVELALWARDLAAAQARRRTAGEAAATARAGLARLAAEREVAAAERRRADETLEAARAERARVRDAVAAAAEEAGRARQRVAVAEGLARNLAGEAGRVAARLQAVSDRLASWDEQVAGEQARQEARRGELGGVEAELVSAASAATTASAAREAARADFERLRAELAAVRAEHRALAGGAAAAEVEAARREVEAAGQALVAATASAQAAREAAAALQAHRAALREALQGDRARAATLRELGGAGYAAGTRNVLAWKLDGILGALADLIEVPSELRRAVEAALGGAAQDLVASSGDAAERAIGELRRRQGGHATFLPLDGLRSAPRPGDGIDRQPGVLGWAGDLVACDAAVRPAVDHVLGRVLVARDLSIARAVARRSGLRLRVVDLDGGVVHPGGALSGGSRTARQGTGLVGRASDVRRLTWRCQAVEADLERVDGALGAAQRRLEEARAAEAAAERRQAAAQATAQRRPVDAARREQLAAMEAQLVGALAGADEALRGAEAAAREAERRHASLGARRASLAEAARGAATLGERLAAERRAVEAEREELERARARALADAAAREAEANAAAAEAAGLAEAAAAVESALTDLAGREREAEAALRAIEARLAAAEGERAAAEAELRRAEVEEARLETAQQALADRLADAYGLSVEALRGVAPAEQPAAARARAAELRRALEEIGPVGGGDAVAAYRQAAAEVEALAAACGDLERARALLDGWCERLEGQIRARYAEVLAVVRQAFRETFERLFGGGVADLVPAGDGLDVVAQPPGKQLGQLTLLSGGERSMVAICLLFALLAARPAAFCVLDEIEAALDEANVGRFASFLAERSRDTQFVIITHQKGTMEVADRLVGVTMNGGVSSLLSVRLAG